MNYPIVLHAVVKAQVDTQAVGSFRTGQSESFFDYKLDKYFRGLILRNQTVRDPSRVWPFQPDYVVKLRGHEVTSEHIFNNPVLIDVEIDEPYTLYRGNFKAIHQIGADDYRNNYFLSKGWDVIRFTEEQVALYPNACCKLISQHLYHRTGDHIWLENFSLTEDVPEIPMWTAAESYDFYFRQTRESYRSSLKVVVNPNAPINIIADGIYLNQLIKEAKAFYKGYYPGKDFGAPASLELFLTQLSLYLHHFDCDVQGERTDVNMYIFISTFHGFHSFDITNDFFEIRNYRINVYFIRTDEIIYFEIDDYIKNRIDSGLMLIGDDPAYTLLMNGWTEQNREIVIFGNNRHMHSPQGFRRINPDMAIGLSLGLESGEV